MATKSENYCCTVRHSNRVKGHGVPQQRYRNAVAEVLTEWIHSTRHIYTEYNGMIGEQLQK